MLSGGRNGSAVPVVTSSVIDPKSDLVAEIDEGGFDGSCLERRWLADAGLAVGSGRAVVAGPAGASVGLSPAAGCRPGRDGRDPARAAHRDAVERVERDRDLQLVVGAPSLPGVGAGRG